MIPRQWLVSCHRRRASAEAHPSVSDPRGSTVSHGSSSHEHHLTWPELAAFVIIVLATAAALAPSFKHSLCAQHHGCSCLREVYEWRVFIAHRSSRRHNRRSRRNLGRGNC